MQQEALSICIDASSQAVLMLRDQGPSFSDTTAGLSTSGFCVGRGLRGFGDGMGLSTVSTFLVWRFLAKTSYRPLRHLTPTQPLHPVTTGSLSLRRDGTFFPVISGEGPALLSSVKPAGQRESVIENQNNWIHEMEFNFGLLVC